ncbi:MAG: YcxB family protein [Clostridia bacterium]|nr:YcxB family protein [Clostridia bacterium]
MNKIKTPVDKKAASALFKNTKILSISLIILGAILIMGVIYDRLNSDQMDFFDLFFLLIGLFNVIFSSVMLVMIGANSKAALSQAVVNEYEFNEDHLLVSSVKNGEVIGTSKVYYKEIVRTRESKDYFFIYPNKAAAFLIGKEYCSDEETAMIRDILNAKSASSLIKNDNDSKTPDRPVYNDNAEAETDDKADLEKNDLF